MQEEVFQRLNESFAPALKEMERRQKEQERQREQQPENPVDYYQQDAKKREQVLSKPRINGSTQKVLVDVCAVTSLLAPQYEKAKDDSERLASLGDKQGSRIVREQYMQDYFLPSVESLVATNSPEEVMNSTKALSEMDKLVLADGGRADGYTYAFVSQLYQDGMGGVLPTSDVTVEAAVREIVRLVQDDQIRAAVGAAQRIKDNIDAGENTASEEDYELIQNVALRGK